MRDAPDDPLLAALAAPPTIALLTLRQWSALVATARGANLLGLLAERLSTHAIDVPAAPRRHLEAMQHLSERQRQSVFWETHELARALAPLDIPVVLLKGAAYAMAGHPVSRGRLFGDIDILVPRAALGDVEVRLMIAGWTSAKSSPYDQRYYRQWMHELPPMINVRRGTVIDIHHTILPLTARHCPDPHVLLDAARPLPELPLIRVPAPEHLLIHSITHLLHEGELPNGLRDLFDIDGLIRAGAQDEAFWGRVGAAAAALGLAGPTYFGLHLARYLIGSPITDAALAGLQEAAGGKAASRGLTALYARALHPAAAGSAAALARFALYVRAHWLRMPPRLLTRHLAHQALSRLGMQKKPALEGRV